MIMSVSEFSEWYGITKRSLYRLIERNEIPHYKVGGVIRLNTDDFKKGESDEEEMVSRNDWRGLTDNDSKFASMDGNGCRTDCVHVMGVQIGGKDGVANTDDSEVPTDPRGTEPKGSNNQA